MADSQQLSRLVESAEDLACALQSLRDEVPRNTPRDATNITGTIADLYRLSAVFRKLDSITADPNYRDRIYRIQGDVRLVCRSASRTLDVAHGMIGRSDDTTQWMVWEDLNHRMKDVEGMSLLTRLSAYHKFMQDLLDQMNGYTKSDVFVSIKGSLQRLLDRQEDAREGGWSYRTIEAPNTPRPRITMQSNPRPPRRAYSDFSDNPRSNPPPPVPEVPSPQSPTLTWTSTRTYISREESPSKLESVYEFVPVVPDHWAECIFNGDRWRSRYRASQQVNINTNCKASPQPDALIILYEEGFVPVAKVSFSDNDSIVTFYWRPRDGRARILFTGIHAHGETLYCTPLTRLRVFRADSILKLCHARSERNHNFWTWAELKFVYHERMVLFYSAFVALKRQDSHGVLEPLIEEPRDMEEVTLFSGVIRDGNMFHALRLLQDHGSRVLRLEARPHRGPRDGVPIWTAFLTKYVGDRDIFVLERGGIVSMICPKPKPYIFASDYGLPLMPDGNELALQFDVREDAKALLEVWYGICVSEGH